MKEWEIFVPYLPRVKSTKRRWDDVSASKSRFPLQTLVLSDVNNRCMEWRRSGCFQPEMIPEPDYTDPEDEDESEEKSGDDDDEEVVKTSDSGKTTDSSGEESQTSKTTSSESVTGSSGSSHTSGGSTSHLSDEGFVLPKKPSNPYLQSTARQRLHKELKFNQKYGKNVVGKKSELQIAMEKYKENKLRKDAALQQTSLEKLLDQRAKRIQMQDSQPEWMDRLKERETWVDPKDDEFYRVHAKVVTHGGYSRNTDDKEERHSSHSKQESSSSP